jgi:DNA-binding MarR family transcriptional regulator
MSEESRTGVEVNRTLDPTKDVGTSLKKSGSYFRYLGELSTGPLSITMLATAVGTSTSGASRDMKDLEKTSPPVIHISFEPNSNGSRSKMVSLTPLGHKLWKLGSEEIRLYKAQRKLDRVDPKLLNFLLDHARSPNPQMKAAALEALLIEADKQRIWESPGVWKLLKELFYKYENLDFATELFHRMVFRACKDEDRNSKASVKEAMQYLWKTKREEEEFWRAIVDVNSPLSRWKDNIIGILEYISTPQEFFQAVWDLWLWRAKVTKPADDLDDRKFWEVVEPLIVEIQATPEKIRRAKVSEAFALIEEGHGKDAQLFLAERARRIATHLLH